MIFFLLPVLWITGFPSSLQSIEVHCYVFHRLGSTQKTNSIRFLCDFRYEMHLIFCVFSVTKLNGIRITKPLKWGKYCIQSADLIAIWCGFLCVIVILYRFKLTVFECNDILLFFFLFSSPPPSFLNRWLQFFFCCRPLPIQ